MELRKSVFGSAQERRNFSKLEQPWLGEFRLYPNLPFLLVAQVMANDVSPSEFSRLKKTSIDYTFCDKRDGPLVCVEFDGMDDGFNLGTSYVSNLWPTTAGRAEMFETKLRVAERIGLPYFIVGNDQFRDLPGGSKLAVIHSIVGDVLARWKVRERLSKGFKPTDVGYTDEEFDHLPVSDQNELIQDWAIGVEVDAEFSTNPITRYVAMLQTKLRLFGCSERYLEKPSVPGGLPLDERIRRLNSARLIGAECAFHTNDLGDVTAKAWLPNFASFGFSGLGTVTEVAKLIALERVRVMRGIPPFADDILTTS